MVGEMRGNMNSERISPERLSEDGGRSSRVALSLNFIVTPWMIAMAQATDGKRRRLTTSGKIVGED
jgi:hypothetical protein